MGDLRRITEAEPYTPEEARRDVAAALLRVVEKDMLAEIRAGERLIQEGKGTPDGLMPVEAIPLCLDATREMLAELRRRAKPKPLRWQCSGCRWGFPGPWQKTCPACGREDYWTGSVHPDAKPWPAPSPETQETADRPPHLPACSPAGCAPGCPWRGEEIRT